MYKGTGKGGVKKPKDAKPNLSGPSKPTRQKMKGGYTNASGVLMDMHQGFLTFVTGGPAEVVPLLICPRPKLLVPLCKTMGQNCSQEYCLMKP